MRFLFAAERRERGEKSASLSILRALCEVQPPVIIGGLLAISVVGALQLRQDERLGEANFLKLMIESFKRMPLLRGAESPEELPKGKEEAKSD